MEGEEQRTQPQPVPLVTPKSYSELHTKRKMVPQSSLNPSFVGMASSHPRYVSPVHLLRSYSAWWLLKITWNLWKGLQARQCKKASVETKFRALPSRFSNWIFPLCPPEGGWFEKRVFFLKILPLDILSLEFNDISCCGYRQPLPVIQCFCHLQLPFATIKTHVHKIEDAWVHSTIWVTQSLVTP